MKLVITEPLGISEAQAEALKKEYLPQELEMVYCNTPPQDDAEKAARAKGAELVMLANMPFKENVLQKLSAVKFLSVAFTGVDHVAMDYCKAHDIVVSNCSGYANEAVSELAIGLAIGLYRKMLAADEAVRAGKTRAGLLGIELSGKKFGVVGAGAIGRRTIALAQAFGCEVYYYNRKEAKIDGAKYVSLDELMEVSDIVSLHVPLTAETKGLIGEKEIAKMKKTAILINTARGPVVDSKALADALKEGRIAGAGIDVFEGEPPIAGDHPLLHAPNVILAPHVGFATQEAMEKRAVIAFKNVQAYLAGKPQNVM
ncbi:MAG: 2-hydroxyacid dehydrogenase [Selenomonas sp.]